MRKKPHSSMCLGSLPLQEFSQQPLHLAVSGVCTFHCLLRVKAIQRTQWALQRKEVKEEQVVLRTTGPAPK